jgi:hypothetical protein
MRALRAAEQMAARALAVRCVFDFFTFERVFADGFLIMLI